MLHHSMLQAHYKIFEIFKRLQPRNLPFEEHVFCETPTVASLKFDHPGKNPGVPTQGSFTFRNEFNPQGFGLRSLRCLLILLGKIAEQEKLTQVKLDHENLQG